MTDQGEGWTTSTEWLRDPDGPIYRRVANFYRQNHTKQTVAFVTSQREKYGSLTHRKWGLWELIEEQDKFVDESDPDLV